MPVTVRGTDILFNDSSTQSTAAVVNTTAVLNATAGAAVGAVGTYAFMGSGSQPTYTPGATAPGSNLRFSGISTASYQYAYASNAGSPIPAGTWRCMGNFVAGGPTLGSSIFLRIS